MLTPLFPQTETNGLRLVIYEFAKKGPRLMHVKSCATSTTDELFDDDWSVDNPETRLKRFIRIALAQYPRLVRENLVSIFENETPRGDLKGW